MRVSPAMARWGGVLVHSQPSPSCEGRGPWRWLRGERPGGKRYSSRASACMRPRLRRGRRVALAHAPHAGLRARYVWGKEESHATPVFRKDVLFSVLCRTKLGISPCIHVRSQLTCKDVPGDEWKSKGALRAFGDGSGGDGDDGEAEHLCERGPRHLLLHRAQPSSVAGPMRRSALSRRRRRNPYWISQYHRNLDSGTLL
eukprot:5617817-Pleurochrysis_carterae.AAC.3